MLVLPVARVSADGATVGHFTNVVDRVSGPCPDDPRFEIGREVSGDQVVAVHEGTLTIGTRDALMTGEITADGQYTIRSPDRTRHAVGRIDGTAGRGLTELILGDPDTASDACRVRFSVTFTLDDPVLGSAARTSAPAPSSSAGAPGAGPAGPGTASPPAAVLGLLATFLVLGAVMGLVAWFVVGPRHPAAAVVPVVAGIAALWAVGHRLGASVGPQVPLYGSSVSLFFDVAVALAAAFAVAAIQKLVIGWRPRGGTR